MDKRMFITPTLFILIKIKKEIQESYFCIYLLYDSVNHYKLDLQKVPF